MKIHNPSPSDIPMLRDLWKEAFGDTDEFLDVFFSTAFDTDRSLCITKDNKIVSALYWFDCYVGCEKSAYIYAVATAVSHRSQGLCRKLMDKTHLLLKDKSYAGAVLVPCSKSLFDFYEKLGYKTCSYVDEFKTKADKGYTFIEEINADEFAKLRRKHLPENAVIQEGENLKFLSAFAKFYKGDDFLLVSYKEKDILHIKEFFGNKEKLASITNTLGAKESLCRTTGSTNPFSMYYPLKSTASPSYFGLAFD